MSTLCASLQQAVWSGFQRAPTDQYIMAAQGNTPDVIRRCVQHIPGCNIDIASGSRWKSLLSALGIIDLGVAAGILLLKIEDIVTLARTRGVELFDLAHAAMLRQALQDVMRRAQRQAR